jgi:hypothetical protein
MIAELRIENILTLIHTSLDEFSVGFIRANGSERVFKPRVRLGIPPSERKLRELQGEKFTEKVNWNQNIKKQHNLLLFDVEKNRPFEIKIPLLMEYNKILVRWYVAKN